MTDLSRPRTPAGVPTGGQFIQFARSEPNGIDLDNGPGDDALDLLDEFEYTTPGEDYDPETIAKARDILAAYIERDTRDDSDSGLVAARSALQALDSTPEDQDFDPEDVEAARDAIRDCVIYEAIGDGPALNDDEKRLLDIITAPENNAFIGNDTGLREVLDSLESAGGDSSFDGARDISELLWAHYENENDDPAGNGAGAFNFDLNRSGDYEVSSYTVGVYLGHDESAWLSQSHDSKYLSVDRTLPVETSDLRKAVAIASVIDGDFQQVRAKARRVGLIGAAEAKPSPWPTSDDERDAFKDWQYEVGNGDTNASFRDWLANREG